MAEFVSGSNSAKRMNRMPKQARAKATCAAILEATARILEAHGEARLNTNLIAETAGVSIGTLYQYFPHKRAILIALANAEHQAWRRNAAVAVAEGLEPDRANIRTHIQSFPGRPHTRRAAVKALLEADPKANWSVRSGAKKDLKSEIEDFIVGRAVLGVIRAAVFEDWPHLQTPEIEEALVRLARTFRST
jgi:AcrR family transcriptional regulator